LSVDAQNRHLLRKQRFDQEGRPLCLRGGNAALIARTISGARQDDPQQARKIHFSAQA
jgi:hypothetical protein